MDFKGECQQAYQQFKTGYDLPNPQIISAQVDEPCWLNDSILLRRI